MLLFTSYAQADFNSGFLLGYAFGDDSSPPVLPHSSVLKAEKLLTQLPSPLQREIEKITLEILRNFQQGKQFYVHSTGVFDTAINDWLTRSEKDPHLKAFFDYFRNKGYQIESLFNFSMKIQYAYKFRLMPTLEQTELLTQSAGSVRKVWNEFLANEIIEFNLAKEKDEKRYFPSYEENCKKLTLLKKFLPYLKEAPSQALQQTLKNLSKAFKGFYEGRTGFPTFKKKSKVKAIHFPQGFKLYKDETGKNGKVFLPTLGYFDFIQHRTIPEDFKVKNVYVRQHGKHWYISFQGEKINSNKEKKLFKCFALDLGIKHFLTSQNNEIVKPLNKLQNNLDKLKFLQQKLSKKTKGSNSWQKLVDRINKLHIHIANCRKDFNHKLSYYIAQHYDIVFMENLDIQNMLKNNSSKLNMQILDQGWYQFKTFLKYKLQHLHKILVEVNPAYTSQTCSHCGHISRKNRQTQASFKCQQCGLTLHADHNAALNIFHQGFYKLKLLQESFSGMEQTSTNSSVSLANVDIKAIFAKALSEATSFRAW